MKELSPLAYAMCEVENDIHELKAECLRLRNEQESIRSEVLSQTNRLFGAICLLTVIVFMAFAVVFVRMQLLFEVKP